MAKQDRVAVVYAQALSGAAGSDMAAVEDAFEALVAAWKAQPALSAFLAAPTIPADQKRRVLGQAFAGSPQVFLNFLSVVVDKGRAQSLPLIQEAFRDLRDRAAGRIRAKAVTASAMTPEQSDRIRKGLQEKLGGEVVLEPEVRPAVLGGIRFKIGDWVADGTLERRLRDLSKRVASAQSGASVWTS